MVNRPKDGDREKCQNAEGRTRFLAVYVLGIWVFVTNLPWRKRYMIPENTCLDTHEFLNYVDVNKRFMLAGVDHPLLYQHLIACTAQTCRMHMLHIRERFESSNQMSLANKNLKLQQRIETIKHLPSIFWHKVDWWCNIMGTSSWEENTEMVDSGTVLHLPRIEYQLWCIWRYPNYNSLIFSLPYSLILSRVCRHGIVQKMACEDAGKSEVGASIVLTDSLHWQQDGDEEACKE